MMIMPSSSDLIGQTVSTETASNTAVIDNKHAQKGLAKSATYYLSTSRLIVLPPSQFQLIPLPRT